MVADDSTACLDDDALAELVDGEVGAARRAEIFTHLAGCAACRRLVAELGSEPVVPAGDDPAGEPGDAPGEDPPDDRLGRGDRIGRLVIERVLGAGAMGVVYAAEDPELHRRVAVKLLRRGSSTPQADRAAIQREARTLARLAHPNVVTLHDVGVHGDQVYLVMELVEGTTLRTWLAARRRTWPELREVFVQLGRGLAAAHAVGLVHRDIKPDNALVGRDGRARITDFGLARAPLVGAGAVGTGAPLVTAPAGTPAYMAPEQLLGATLDARADLFGFCVMLYEAIHDRRPAIASSPPAALDAAALRTRAPVIRGVPRRARRALGRGLARDPADRPPTMTALVDELAHRAVVTPLRAIAALAVVGGALGAGLALRTPEEAAPVCAGAAAAWGAPWSADQRAALATAFGPADARAFAIVDAAVAGYRDRWQAMHRTVCLAHQRGEDSDQALDQRMACLRDRRDEAAAVIAILAAGDRAVRARAIETVGGLSPIADCDGRAITELAPLPAEPARRAAVATALAAAAKAKAESDAARWGQCRAAADAAVPAARAAGYDPAIARLLFQRAYCTEDVAAAIGDLHDAAMAAERGRDDFILVRSWSRLAFLMATRQGDLASASRWEAYARAALDRLGDSDEGEYIWLANAGARLAAARKFDDALAAYARMPALATRLGGPASWRHAAIEAMIGDAYADSGRPSEALAHHTRAVALDAALHGPDSITALDGLANELNDLLALDRVDDALALYPRVHALQQRADPDGDDSYYRHRHASALRLAGDYAAALPEDRAAEATCARFAGPDARTCAVAWLGEGFDLLTLGPPGAALAPIERALTLYGEAAPPVAQFALARALVDRDLPRARAAAERARAALRADLARYGGDRADLDEIEGWLGEHGGLAPAPGP
jgi:tetratricopeptide (TPR) repeat protein